MDRRATDEPQGRSGRRGMYILPSLFTCGNIAAGFYAILQTMHGSALDPSHYDYAAMLIGFAILFDGLDGRIARMTNTTSDFGKELDSLADVITFGVAPALLAYFWGFGQLAGINDRISSRVQHLGAIVSLPVSGERCGAPCAFQHRKEPSAKEPRAPWTKILCRHADSSRRRDHCSCRALHALSDRYLVDRGHLGGARILRGIPDGLHLAFL